MNRRILRKETKRHFQCKKTMFDRTGDRCRIPRFKQNLFFETSMERHLKGSSRGDASIDSSDHLPTSSNAIHAQHADHDRDRDASTSSLESYWAENGDEHGSSSSLPWVSASVHGVGGRDGYDPCSTLKYRRNDRYG